MTTLTLPLQDALSSSLTGQLVWPGGLINTRWTEAIKLKNRRLDITPACAVMVC